MVSNTVAIIIIALAVLALFVFGGGCKNQKDNFTRTCLTADTNCSFVRSPVDYAYKTITSIPSKVGKDHPHLMADPSDEFQPLEQGVDLIKDEKKLWNQDLLWRQYGNDWSGCGNGQSYIVNDEKTRASLSDAGNEWARRMLDSQRLPEHGPNSSDVITEQDMIAPEPHDRLYGGSDFLPQNIGY